MEFQRILTQAVGRLGGKLESTSGGRGYSVSVALGDGRGQRIAVTVEDETVRFTTQCSGWLPEYRNPNIYKMLLQKNFKLTHCAFALDDEGGVVLVNTHHKATCDEEEAYLTILNLAKLGDFLEQEFAQGKGGKDLF